MKHMRRTLATLGSLVLTGVLGVVLPVSVAPPAGASIQCGFTWGTQVQAPVPDPGTKTSTTNLSWLTGNDRIVDLDVTINLSHFYTEDLVVSLSYGGHTVQLFNRRGGGGDHLTNTRFNDGAATRISAGVAPFSGNFRPEQSLNAFDDLDPAGVWTLQVTDVASGIVGTLHDWTLTLRTEWCDDDDRDRVVDSNDLCLQVKGVHPHGCPVRTRTLTILYAKAAKEFRGKLQCTSARRCQDSQPVRIYKLQAGKDALISRVYTNATGNYVAPKTGVRGKYYAVAPKVVEENVAECARAQSANLTV